MNELLNIRWWLQAAKTCMGIDRHMRAYNLEVAAQKMVARYMEGKAGHDSPIPPSADPAAPFESGDLLGGPTGNPARLGDFSSMRDLLQGGTQVDSEVVRIQYCAGLPQLDFFISKVSYEDAALAANINRRNWYVGVLPGGNEVLGPDRQRLADMGCEQIAHITPSMQADTSFAALERMYGGAL